MLEWARGRSWGWWLRWAVLGALVGGGIWAFSSEKPNHDMQVQVLHREAGEGRIEVALQSIDHLGAERRHVPADSVVDLAAERERYTYTQPVELPGFGPLARVTLVSDEPGEAVLGFRVNRPNGSWSSSRFPSREALTLAERESAEWLLSRPLTVRVNVNQPLLAGVRLVYYALIALAFVFGVTLYIWRRWLN